MNSDESRAAFEVFAQDSPMGRFSVQRDTRPGREDGYWSSHTQIMWDTWKACMALSGRDGERYRWHRRRNPSILLANAWGASRAACEIGDDPDKATDIAMGYDKDGA